MRLEFNETGMGTHCILNLHECDIVRLQNLLLFEKFAANTLARNGAIVKGHVQHGFGFPGYGFTSLYLLSTSHYSVHTWPETFSAAVDVFTCGDVDTAGICSDTIEYFGAARHSLVSVLR